MNTRNGWTVVEDQWKGSYAYKDDKWVAFDNIELIHHKARFVREQNLLGVALVVLETDDPKNDCGRGKYPALNMITSVLKEPRNYNNAV